MLKLKKIAVDDISASLQVTFVLVLLFCHSGNSKQQAGNQEFVENDSLAESILKMQNTEIKACKFNNLNVLIRTIPATIFMGFCSQL